jgi:acyl dehydratase
VIVTAPTAGGITDAALAELRGRIGVPQIYPAPPHFLRPGTDAFRLVAWSYGDDNPLYADPQHAAASRWGEPIAPPSMVGGDSVVGEDELTPAELEAAKQLKGDPLRGVHAFYAASEREWWAPLRADRAVRRRTALVGVLDKPSDFGGRGIQEWTAQAFQDDTGRLLGAQYRMMFRAEREKSKERGKYADIAAQVWDEEGIAEIELGYAAETRRARDPRWWEDVNVGDRVGPMYKGPLTVTDMVCWHVGMGMGMYRVSPLRLGYENRKRIPRFYHHDSLGIPDVMQRVHWDPVFAQRTGNPTTYDYGRMRETWILHACTDWMGDDAWLWKLGVEFRAFNYVSDLQVVTGSVIRKYLAEGDRPAVDLELVTTNQHGKVTTPGTASILLPSREHGAVRLPEPPGGARDLPQALAASIDAFDRR